jgi:hypothetical protein
MSMAMLVISIYEISVWFEVAVGFIPFLQASGLVDLLKSRLLPSSSHQTYHTGHVSLAMNCDMSVLHRGVVEVFAVLRCYAEQIGRWLPKSAAYMLRGTSQKSEGLDHKSVGSKIGAHTGCPEDYVVFLSPLRLR